VINERKSNVSPPIYKWVFVEATIILKDNAMLEDVRSLKIVDHSIRLFNIISTSDFDAHNMLRFTHSSLVIRRSLVIHRFLLIRRPLVIRRSLLL